jgi:hypothetical protein
MRNVTSEMRRFKEASRHLWNAYLMPGEGVIDVALEDSFRSIERELLRSLVLQGDDAADAYGRAPIEGLSVRSKSDYDQVPVQFASDGLDGNTYWRKSEFVSAAEISYEFLEFFDWMHYGFIDYPMVRAIDRSSGRHVLIESMYCDFWLS